MTMYYKLRRVNRCQIIYLMILGFLCMFHELKRHFVKVYAHVEIIMFDDLGFLCMFHGLKRHYVEVYAYVTYRQTTKDTQCTLIA